MGTHDQADPHVLRPDHHPTPFTADEIRAGSPLGRTVRQRIEETGEPVTLRIQQYVAVDDESGTRLVSTIDADGTRHDTRRSTSTWLELQGHASMPIASTSIDEVALDSPIGPLDCLRYSAVDGDEIETFWFARTIPGMPVMTERRVAGELVERVTMLSSSVEPLLEEPEAPSSGG